VIKLTSIKKKKKNLGAKIFVWILVLVMVISTIGFISLW